MSQGPGVAELVPGEAQGMERGDLGLGLPARRGERERALGQAGGGDGVRLDLLEGGPGQRERILGANLVVDLGHVSGHRNRARIS